MTNDPRKVIDNGRDFAEMMVKTLKTISRVIVTDNDGEPYIERLRLKRLPNGGTEVLHIFYHSDEDPPHNHPWDFESTIVYGSYIEHCPGKEPRIFRPGDVNKKQAEEFHRLEVAEGPVITLMRRSKWRRKWCFLTPEGPVESLEWLRRQGIKPHG
jgi:hypothetical protein